MTHYVQKLQGDHHYEFFAGDKQERIKKLRYRLSDSHF